MTTKSMAGIHSAASRLWLLLVVPALFVAILPASSAALTTISQGYTTTDPVTNGSIVSLMPNTTDKITAATTKSAGTLLGIVINEGNSLLSLSNGSGNQVQVATSGTVQVLVSDINGVINEGDQVTASPISGVGMKATNTVKVIGIAQGNLTNGNSEKQTYKDKSGQHSVRVGQIPLLVNVSYYYKQPDKTVIPSTIQNVANALAGKSVNAAPVLVSLGIFLITMIIVASILYSMIRSSIISVGRNPMSQSAIYRDLLQMSALVVGILAVSMGAIYMILTKF